TFQVQGQRRSRSQWSVQEQTDAALRDVLQPKPPAHAPVRGYGPAETGQVGTIPPPAAALWSVMFWRYFPLSLAGHHGGVGNVRLPRELDHPACSVLTPEQAGKVVLQPRH